MVKDFDTDDAIVVSAADGRAYREDDVSSDLIERAQRGEHEAFDELATAVYDRLYAIAGRVLRDPYAAEDAVQDALIRAWRDLRALRDPARFDAWLHTLLIHACHDQVRRRHRRPVEVRAIPVEPAASGDDMALIADRDAIERAFVRLSVEHRAALVLTHYVGLPAREVASILGVPPGTVHSRLHYAAREMRQALTATSGAVADAKGAR